MTVDNDLDTEQAVKSAPPIPVIPGPARFAETKPEAGPATNEAKPGTDEARPGTKRARPEPKTEPPTHTVVLPRVSTDPLDELVDRIRPTLTRAVDALQVAAALEADGFTDRIARVEYGFSDVFALAAEVFRRLGPPVDQVPEPNAAARNWRGSVRLLAHGPLYALPSAVFPAVLGVLGQRSVVLALTVASGLGWVYAGTVAYGAYRLLGANRPRASARLLRITTLAAPAAGALAGLAVIGVAGGGWGLVLLAAGQLAYQLAGTVLVFYRREALQVFTMVPAVVAGCAYLTIGMAMRPIALATAALSVATAYVAGLWLTRGHGNGSEPSARPLLRLQMPGMAGVTCYGFCSAALLLLAGAPYLLTDLDIAIAVAPLIAAMGFVEWRAERFRGRAIDLTHNSHRPQEFQRRVWQLVVRETALCLAVPAVLGLALIAALAAAGRLSAPGVVMVAANVVLGSAYFSAFLLAGFERFGWLCACMLAALVMHIGVGALLGASPLLGQTDAPLTDTTLYLGSVIALLGLFPLGLVPFLGQVRHFR